MHAARPTAPDAGSTNTLVGTGAHRGCAYSVTRSTLATTGLARNCAMIALRCLRS
jgi:hypothetical protein